AGIDLRTLQELAGHSTSKLTERYTHVALHDLAGAVEKLPSILPAPAPQQQEIALRATGTEGPNPPVAYEPLTSAVDGGRGKVMEKDGGNPKSTSPAAVNNRRTG